MAVTNFSDPESGRNTYQCDGCGDIDVWTDQWFWYGSYNDLEDSKSDKPLTFCSSSCNADYRQRQFERGDTNIIPLCDGTFLDD